MLHSMSQTREKWDPSFLSRGDFWVIWKCHGISCFNFVFCLETTVRVQTIAVMVNFFSKVSFQKYSIQLCSNFVLSNYDAPWQRHLKDTLQLKFYGHGSTSVSTLHQDIWLIIVSFSFSQTNLVFKFNLVLIE